MLYSYDVTHLQGLESCYKIDVVMGLTFQRSSKRTRGRNYHGSLARL